MQSESEKPLTGTVQRFVLAGLIAVMLLVTLVDLIARERHTPLPGSMHRARDSLATAISYVQYGLWDGYASYRAVNDALLDSGLAVLQEERRRQGLPGYVEIMLTPALLQQSFDAATSLTDASARGLYFMQDEKGLAILYILAFELFGIKLASLFYLYMLFLAVSLGVAVVTFWRRIAVLHLLLVYVCVHYAMALIIPEMPRQDINFIQGNRFLGILAVVPMLHLMLIVLYRLPPTLPNVIGVCWQVAVLMLLVNARNSVFWTVLACYGLVVVVCLLEVRRPAASALWHRLRAATRSVIPTLWPVGILLVGTVLLGLHQRYGLNEHYSTPDGQLGRVFWHNVTTALANHPEREARLGVPAAAQAYDDQVGYMLFEREIERRGESRDAYIVKDGDWYYRTNLPGLDFRWGTYDLVLRDFIFRLAAEDPAYVAEALLYYQPLTAIRITTSPALLRWQYILAPSIVLALVIGTVVAGACVRTGSKVIALAWFVAFLAALAPTLVAAVVELRVADFAFLVIFGGWLLSCLVLSWLVMFVRRYVASRSRA